MLHDLLQSSSKGKGKESPTRVEYELNSDSGLIEPRLRLWVDPPSRVQEVEEDDTDTDDTEDEYQPPLFQSLQSHAIAAPDVSATSPLDTVDYDNNGSKVEIVIPLVSDSAFFQLLAATLQALSEHLLVVHAQFAATLEELTRAVSDSARPVSSTSSRFKPHSPLQADPGGVRVDASSRKVCSISIQRREAHS